MRFAIFRLSSWQQVLIGLVLGIVVGVVFKHNASVLGYLGSIFLNLIKMITVPMIFFAILFGITSVETSIGLYRISMKAFAAFFITSVCAVAIGIGAAAILKPGSNVSPSILDAYRTATPQSFQPQSDSTIMDMLINIIPTNVFEAMASGNILQVILFAFFVGVTLNIKHNECANLIKICHEIAKMLFQAVQMIMKIAPIGVFGYMASMVGEEGIGIIFSLGELMITIFLGCLAQYIFFGILIIVWGKLSPIPFYKKVFGCQMIAFSTSSSKATLVPLMQVAEKNLGVSRQNSRFLLPLSAALNMDGGAIYQGACAIFFAQMMGVDLSFANYMTLFFMCTFASIGGAGIPGGVLLFLGMVLHSVGLPVEGVLLIASVDRILDMATTLLNITGCACVTLLVDKSEKTLNIKLYNSKSKPNMQN